MAEARIPQIDPDPRALILLQGLYTCLEVDFSALQFIAEELALFAQQTVDFHFKFRLQGMQALKNVVNVICRHA
jgi:hypothetical protein